ncbi:MAG TPA: LacI family DNA-binding transcriptional regulator [Acidobacteriaceae bacterium]|nr:LacI family DNA-binding transcriptional regulator [Acidobacteriaceae bacterium]
MSERKLVNNSSGQAPRPPRTTLKALAHHLGLSPTTVSFVISGSPLAETIAKSTRDRIWAASEELNYRPNVFARYLHTKKSYSVAVLVPDVSDEYSAALIGGIESCLAKKGFFYFVVSHRGAPELMEKSPETLLDRGVEGMIFINTPLHQSLPVPVVAICDITEGPGITRIMIDNNKAAALAADHLVQLGHRDIAVIQGPQGNGDTEHRWRALRKACRQKEIQIDPLNVAHLGVYPACNERTMAENGFDAARELLAHDKPFTALVAFNDASAIGAIRALADAGLRVPQDISVLGFDDIPQSSFTVPRLTTIRQPLASMGELAAETLLEKIAGNSAGPGLLKIEPELVVRETTAPCAPRSAGIKIATNFACPAPIIALPEA